MAQSNEGVTTPDVRGEIVRRLIDGSIRPGERIAEQRLADEIGVSRTPVREALAVLQAEGHVHRTANGCQAADYSLDELADAFEVRAELEGLAAFRAAERADAAAIARLRRAYEAMNRAYLTAGDDPLPYAQLMTDHNRRFHDTVRAATGNDRLALAMRSVVIAPLIVSAFAWYTGEERHRSDDAHRGIADAIAARDTRRARRLMTEHIFDGRDVVLRNLGSLGMVRELGGDALWDRLEPQHPPRTPA